MDNPYERDALSGPSRMAASSEGEPVAWRPLQAWVKAALRFIDLCDADAEGYDDLHETADRLRDQGFAFFGAGEDDSLATLEHMDLIVPAHHATPFCQTDSDTRNAHLASTPQVAVPVSEELMKALAGFDDDYMTSEKHHPDYVLIPVAKFERICAALGLEVDTGPKTVMVRDTDSVCKTCRWRGDHAPDCVRKDEPWPMIEVSADSLEGRAALTAALAVPDKGVQGDQGNMASRDPGNDQCGSQPEADVGATAALAGDELQAELDLLGGLVLELEDGHSLTINDPKRLANSLRRVLSAAYPTSGVAS